VFLGTATILMGLAEPLTAKSRRNKFPSDSCAVNVIVA
jgi:hypothetical protein